jgi:TolB-like protein/tetratricopeptide (TPR) repeat protein
MAGPDAAEDAPLLPTDIRRQLETMLASRTFRTAEGQKSFLKYAVEEVLAGRAGQIKEYLIGVEAFNRGELFDPRLDPIVRTQARKLRARLVKYYLTEGVEDPIRIEFPKGSYVPTFARMGDPPAVAEVAPAAVEISPAQVQEPTSIEAEATPPFRFSQTWKVGALAAALLALVVGAGFIFYAARVKPAERTIETASSVAVLPFVNLNGDSANEFLSDGLTDDLIESLGQVPGLRVAGRTSSFRFKGKAMNIREIGQQLQVHALLKGTVRVSGDRLRITAQLNNAADGHHLWSGSFERDTNDAREIQRDISAEVAGVLGARMVHGGDEKTISSANPESPNHDAYQNYLQGLYHWNKLKADELQMAIGYFEKAIAADPSFARAYTALADCYVMAPQVSTTPPNEIVPKIRAAAGKALALDSSLGEAHIDLAICAEYDFDWATAGVEFRKGLDLSPDNAVAHLWYAKYLAVVGRRPEVLVQREIAAELDPVSPYAVQAVGGYLSVTGRYDEAIAQFRKAITLEPNFGLSHQGLGVAYILRGRDFPEGIAELQTACKLMPGPRREALLGWAYATIGETAEARQILNRFLAESNRPGFPALAVGQVYIGLGDKDRAFEWLGKAADQKDLDLTLKWDSFYEPLRSDARYFALLRRLKLS